MGVLTHRAARTVMIEHEAIPGVGRAVTMSCPVRNERNIEIQTGEHWSAVVRVGDDYSIEDITPQTSGELFLREGMDGRRCHIASSCHAGAASRFRISSSDPLTHIPW
jgi:hypothetical protein